MNLPAGTTQLEVTDEDAAGNVSLAADFTVFVNETAPASPRSARSLPTRRTPR